MASLQASNKTIDTGFYISICIAVIIFVLCLYLINRPRTAKQPNIKTHTQIAPLKNQPVIPVAKKQAEQTPTPIPAKPTQQDLPEPKKTVPEINLTRPPKLILPKNIEQIAANQYAKTQQTEPTMSKQTNQQKPLTPQNNQYDKGIAELFSNCAYLVKPNPKIAGLKTNLFAIGNKEVLWLGCVDCDIKQLKTAINQLKTTFKETLQDITITVYSFLLDTGNRYKSEENLFVFHNMNDLKKFIYDHQGLDISPSDQEDFDAYSEYIDTVITLLYKG